jgi:regulatory protein
MPTGKITALRAQANDPQRVNLFINDKFAIGISLNTISKLNLYVGQEVTDDGYARIEQTEGADKAMQIALRFLEARPRSSAEIRERLRQKAFDATVIEQALERLSQAGLIDDDAFARFWVENRQTCRPRGIGALRNELRLKGVDRAIVETVLSDDELTGDEPERAMTLARAAVRKYAKAPDRMTFTRRLGGYLQRRGFNFETIRPIVDQLWDELRQGQDAEDIEPAEP